MKLFAIISGDNEVVGKIRLEDSDTETIQFLAERFSQVIDATNLQPEPQIGWGFDGQNIISTSPSKKITRYAMRKRFTTNELVAIYTAAKQNVLFEVLKDDLSTTAYVDLARADVQVAAAGLVQAGILTQQRADEILTSPVLISEAYVG